MVPVPNWVIHRGDRRIRTRLLRWIGRVCHLVDLPEGHHTAARGQIQTMHTPVLLGVPYRARRCLPPSGQMGHRASGPRVGARPVAVLMSSLFPSHSSSFANVRLLPGEFSMQVMDGDEQMRTDHRSPENRKVGGLPPSLATAS